MLTVIDLYTRWDKGITKLIVKAGVHSSDVQDVKQQIYLEFLRGQVFGFCPKCNVEHVCSNDDYDENLASDKEQVAKGEELAVHEFFCRECEKHGEKIVMTNIHRKGYEEIYDPTKSAESTFIYHFVQRRCMQYISRNFRDPLKLAVRGQMNEDGEEMDLLDIIPAKQPDVAREVDLTMAIARLKERLDGVPVRSMVEDLNVERSLRKVLEYLEKGLRQRQIAARLSYSEPSVSLMVKEIRKLAEGMNLQELID